jgi:colicin import membrane protein
VTTTEENTETGAGAGSGEQREGEVRAAQAAVRTAIEHALSIQTLDSKAAAQLSGEVEGPADVYALDEWVQATAALAVQFCRFPGCFHPPRPAIGPGKPPAYCQSVLDERGQPAHTAVRSMRMRHRLRSPSPRTTPPPEPGDQAGERPVSWARASVPQLVARVERLIADSQTMITRALTDLQATVTLLGDDEARAAELESVHHDSTQAIEAAKGDKLAAEQSAREARASAERARAEQAEAIAAAEEALARAEQIEAEAAERITAAEGRVHDAEEATSRAEQAAQDARAERDRQAEQITRLQTELEWLRQRTETDQQHHRSELHRLEAQLRQASEQATATRVELATTTAQLAAERTGTDQLRAQYAHQLRDLRQAAEDRVSALSRALEIARAAAESYRTQSKPYHLKIQKMRRLVEDKVKNVVRPQI